MGCVAPWASSRGQGVEGYEAELGIPGHSPGAKYGGVWESETELLNPGLGEEKWRQAVLVMGIAGGRV